MTELQALVGLAGAPVVAALVTVVKPFLPNDKFYPLAALFFGILWNLLLAQVLGQTLGVAVLMGVLSGLSASGAYSSVKALRA